MFRGNHPTRVDEKGRLKVPADFKRELDERYSAPQPKTIDARSRMEAEHV